METSKFRGPALSLVGRELPSGWKVVKALPVPKLGSGGVCSLSYRVEHKEQGSAFLKAIDFSKAILMPDPARELERLTALFNLERDLLEKCAEKRMPRIVKYISDGKIQTETDNPYSIVQYIIAEIADTDVRQFISRLNFTEALVVSHQVATGLRQLHASGIAHQDIKPSNILMFGPGINTKIGDLGSAVERGRASPHDDVRWTGDPVYAPPEVLYGHYPTDWVTRRIKADYFLLGSMIYYLFVGVPVISELIKRLPSELHPENCNRPYAEVIPYLKTGFATIIGDFRTLVTKELAGGFDEEFAVGLSTIVKQLCTPDPIERGHPLNLELNLGWEIGLERYISKLDLLAAKARVKLAAPRK